jgi:hypothetical protein
VTTQQQSDPALNLYQTHWRTTVLLYDQIPYLHDMLADYETNPEIDEYIAGMRAFLIHWLLALLGLCDRARFLGLSLDEGLTTSIEQTIDALRAVEKTFFECPLPASEPPLPPNKPCLSG